MTAGQAYSRPFLGLYNGLILPDVSDTVFASLSLSLSRNSGVINAEKTVSSGTPTKRVAAFLRCITRNFRRAAKMETSIFTGGIFLPRTTLA